MCLIFLYMYCIIKKNCSAENPTASKKTKVSTMSKTNAKKLYQK